MFRTSTSYSETCVCFAQFLQNNVYVGNSKQNVLLPITGVAVSFPVLEAWLRLRQHCYELEVVVSAQQPHP
jgi:hypothetical protein